MHALQLEPPRSFRAGGEAFSERLWLDPDGQFRYVCWWHVIHGGQGDEDDWRDTRSGVWRAYPGALVLETRVYQREANYGAHTLELEPGGLLAFVVHADGLNLSHAEYDTDAAGLGEAQRVRPSRWPNRLCPCQNGSEHTLTSIDDGR